MRLHEYLEYLAHIFISAPVSKRHRCRTKELLEGAQVCAWGAESSELLPGKSAHAVHQRWPLRKINKCRNGGHHDSIFLSQEININPFDLWWMNELHWFRKLSHLVCVPTMLRFEHGQRNHTHADLYIIYICAHLGMYVCIYLFIYLFVYLCIYFLFTYTYAYTSTHINIYIYIDIDII